MGAKNKKKNTDTWTEASLDKKINDFKNNADSIGLIGFLETCLADDDPCCVSNRDRFWNELGVVRINQEAFDLAETCFENALKITPDYIAAQYNLATFLMQKDEFKAALERYNAILAVKPDHFNCLFNAALCHSYIGSKDAAVEFYMRAANLRPENGQIQFLTGEVLLQTGEAKSALPFFKAAQKLNPGHFESSQGLAIALLETKNYEEAIRICDDALIEYGTATLPLQVKADALIALGRIAEAIECHVDLTRIDLDIRDFLVTRIQKLARQEEKVFAQYSRIVNERYPEFKSFLGNIQKKEDL